MPPETGMASLVSQRASLGQEGRKRAVAVGGARTASVPTAALRAGLSLTFILGGLGVP